ncbi:MAG: GH25 family lysozyme [Hyphomonas sp.]|uniref:glycoside hydrolase family 25 protein n=1 Tax=Hyphomonas sp. TaxID=87 RepID=UPI0035284F0C
MRHRAPILAACLALAAACGAPAPESEAVASLLEPGAEGIDISHHNGRIDWDLLDTAPIDFIYLKATEGGDWKDPDFQQNWRQATGRGWLAGAYHFYLLCRDGETQAANFIQSVEVRDGTLPPAVDLEYAHNCAPSGSKDAARAELRVFLARLEAEYGQRPVLYTTPDFHADWLAGAFADYPVWMRSLSGPPEEGVLIWQYSMKGRVAGIEGPVDLNLVPVP